MIEIQLVFKKNLNFIFLSKRIRELEKLSFSKFYHLDL